MTEKSPFPRRQFLSNSAITAAAAATFPSGVRAQGENGDQIGLALVGCGGRGTGAASQAMQADDGVRLVAMADVDPERLSQSREILTKGGKINRSPDGTKHGNKVDVPPERQFIGLDAYRKVMEQD